MAVSPGKIGAAWSNKSSADVASLALPAQTVTIGDLIYVVGTAAAGSAPTSLVPSDGSNTYTLLQSGTSSTLFASVYWAKAVATASITITMTPSASATVAALAIELRAQDATAPVDASNVSTGTSTGGSAFANTTATATYGSDLALGSVHWLGASVLSAQTFTPAGTGQNNETTVSATGAHACSVALSEVVEAASGSQSFQATLAGSVAYAAVLAAITGSITATPTVAAGTASLSATTLL